MNVFKVGDRVRLLRHLEYLSCEAIVPKGAIGTIIDDDATLPDVRWDVVEPRSRLRGVGEYDVCAVDADLLELIP